MSRDKIEQSEVCADCRRSMKITHFTDPITRQDFLVRLCRNEKCDSNHRNVAHPEFRCHCGAVNVILDPTTGMALCKEHNDEEARIARRQTTTGKACTGCGRTERAIAVHGHTPNCGNSPIHGTEEFAIAPGC